MFLMPALRERRLASSFRYGGRSVNLENRRGVKGLLKICLQESGQSQVMLSNAKAPDEAIAHASEAPVQAGTKQLNDLTPKH